MIILNLALTALQVRSIADLVLAQTAARLTGRGIGLEVTEATMAHICKEGYDQARLRGRYHDKTRTESRPDTADRL